MKDIVKWLSYYSKAVPSEHGKRVAELLDAWTGLHHLESSTIAKADWSSKYAVEVWTRQTLSTYDFDELTRLVFLAHDYCIRVEIDVHGPRMLGLMFHPRVRDGHFAERHPTLEQAVAKWRERHPIAEVAPELATIGPATRRTESE